MRRFMAVVVSSAFRNSLRTADDLEATEVEIHSEHTTPTNDAQLKHLLSISVPFLQHVYVYIRGHFPLAPAIFATPSVIPQPVQKLRAIIFQSNVR